MLDVRPALDADLPALVDTLGQERFFTGYLDRQRTGAGTLLVAWLDGRPVGDVYLRCEPADEPEIREHLAGVPLLVHHEVHPEHQRRGIGTALIEAAERLAAERGLTRTALAVGVDNPDAVRLYRRLRYVDWRRGTVDVSWEEPGHGMVTLICEVLVKPLVAPDVEAWQPWHPQDVAARLVGLDLAWSVAGGWAIDLYLGRQTRPHSDLEIAIPRAELDRLRPAFADLSLFAAGTGRVAPLGGDEDPRHHQVWVLDPVVNAWRLDTFLEPGDRNIWVSHRDARIRRAYREAVARTAEGIPYLRPEIVLFTKAKHRRDKDEVDLAVTLPSLDHEARRWLAEALALAHPGHPWLARVA